MNISPGELALLMIVAIDVLIVGALIVVRLLGLRGRRAASYHVTLARENQAPDMRTEELGRRLVRPSAFTTSVTPAAASTGTAAGQERTDQGITAPEQMTAEDEGDWQLALRKESARAARYGRSMTLMQFEIDEPVGGPDAAGQLAEADVLLAGLVAAHVRASDYVVHPSPGRCWLLLTETEERAALWVADRIRGQFLRQRPNPPRLLVGWAGSEPAAGVESTLRRAAERVREDRRRVHAAFD